MHNIDRTSYLQTLASKEISQAVKSSTTTGKLANNLRQKYSWQMASMTMLCNSMIVWCSDRLSNRLSIAMMVTNYSNHREELWQQKQSITSRPSATKTSRDKRVTWPKWGRNAPWWSKKKFFAKLISSREEIRPISSVSMSPWQQRQKRRQIWRKFTSEFLLTTLSTKHLLLATLASWTSMLRARPTFKQSSWHLRNSWCRWKWLSLGLAQWFTNRPNTNNQSWLTCIFAFQQQPPPLLRRRSSRKLLDSLRRQHSTLMLTSDPDLVIVVDLNLEINRCLIIVARTVWSRRWAFVEVRTLAAKPL